MEKQKAVERRKSIRVHLASLVLIRCDIHANISNKEKLEFHTHTEEISEGGIRVILDRELRSPDPVELRLYMTGSVAPLECKGQIVWSKIASPEGVEPDLYATGIKFVGLNSDCREAIGKIISCFK